jgi:hypothetical protein
MMAQVGEVAKDANVAEKTSSPVYGRTNYFVLDTPFGSAAWNTVASHEIATVTGCVRMRVVAECNQTVTAAGETATLALGTEKATGGIIAAAIVAAGSDDGNSLQATDVWFDTTPAPADSNGVVAYTSGMIDKVVVGGLDVGYTVGAAALTGGCIRWHIWWEPLDATGNVAAGAGGGLN